MRVLFVHAHFDDFEFTASGVFELLRRMHGEKVVRRVLVCTDGGAGHHRMSREETAKRRLREQEEAATLGGFEFRVLRDRGGQAFREARLHSSDAFLPALWNEIRSFQPDYLLCPPIPENPLLGVHVDHLDVAHAVRSVAYLINVPHAFSPEYPGQVVTGGGVSPRENGCGSAESEAVGIRTPVILNTFDGYMSGGHGFDLAVDVTAVADGSAELAWCHASQLQEWLPWVNRHNLTAPTDLTSWKSQYRSLLRRRARALGIESDRLYEVFSVTAWGVVPTVEQLLRDIPGLDREVSRLETLRERLSAWHAAAGE